MQGSRLDNRLCQVPELKSASRSRAGQHRGARRAPGRIIHFLIHRLQGQDWPTLHQATGLTQHSARMHLKEKVKPLSATAEAITRSHDKEMIAVKAQATGKMPQQQHSAPVDVVLCWPRQHSVLCSEMNGCCALLLALARTDAEGRTKVASSAG